MITYHFALINRHTNCNLTSNFRHLFKTNQLYISRI